MSISLSFPAWKLLTGPLVAFATCFFLTPPVRRFAVNVDAIDVPNERRINDHFLTSRQRTGVSYSVRGLNEQMKG